MRVRPASLSKVPSSRALPMVTPHGFGRKGQAPRLSPYLSLHGLDRRAKGQDGPRQRLAPRGTLCASHFSRPHAQSRELLAPGLTAEHAATCEQGLLGLYPAGPPVTRGRARRVGRHKGKPALAQFGQQLAVIQDMQREGAQPRPKGGHVRQDQGEHGAGMVTRAPMQVLDRAHPWQARLRYQPAVQARC